MEYFSEKLIENSNEDYFGHLEIAKEIGKIIQNNNSSSHPITIGIFGKWGVGKSSIIKLLKNEILPEDDDYKYVDVPIWKYSEAKSIRRKFIYQIIVKLDKKESLNNIYCDITNEISSSYLKKVGTFIESILKDTYKLVLAIALIFFVWIASRMISRDFLNIEGIKVIDIAFIITIMPLFFSLINLLNHYKTNISQKPYESEEQFEHEIENILKENNNQKKIIVIDDLDRCDNTKILAVFEVIKNFLELENCIFIISCDPNIVRNAIEIATPLDSSARYGYNYLDKIFQFVVHVPQQLPQNMRDFVSKLIENDKTILLNCEPLKSKLHSIIYILIYKNTINPRKAKSLINKFILDYKLVLVLEGNKKTFLQKNQLSSFPERLAFCTILKSEYPESFTKFEKAPLNGLKEWIEKNITDVDFLEFYKQNLSLFNEDWDITPFLYFNDDPSIHALNEFSFDNPYLIKEFLCNNRFDLLQREIGEDENKVNGIIKFAFNQIELTKNDIELQNIILQFIYYFKFIDFKKQTIKDQPNILLTINSSIIKFSLLTRLNKESLIAYICYLFYHHKSYGIDLMTHTVINSLSDFKVITDSVWFYFFEDKYFDTIDTHYSNQLKEYIKLNPKEYSNYFRLKQQILKINYKKLEYFNDINTDIKKQYTKLLEESDAEKNNTVLEDIENKYFEILDETIKYRNNYFGSYFSEKIPVEKYIKNFEKQFVENINDDIFLLLFGGLNNIIVLNDLSTIEKEFLDLLKKIVERRNQIPEIEDKIETLIARDLNNYSIENYQQENITLLLNTLLSYITKHNYNFNKLKILLFEKIDYFEEPVNSNSIFLWTKDNTKNFIETSKILEENILKLLIARDTLELINSQEHICNGFFDYLTFLINNANESNLILEENVLKIDDNEDIFHYSNLNTYNDKLISRLFQFANCFDNKYISHNKSFEQVYFDILSNHKNYKESSILKSITSLINIHINDYSSYAADSKEILTLTKVLTESTTFSIKYNTFILRMLITRQWWRNDFSLINSYRIIVENLPENTRRRYYTVIENKFINFISPNNWGNNSEYFTSNYKPLCLIINDLIHKHDINQTKLVSLIIEALEYFTNRKGYKENIKLNLELLLNDKLNKTHLFKQYSLAKNIRVISIKYKPLRELNKEIVTKFELKINKSLLK